jgi:hypothetical protein
MTTTSTPAASSTLEYIENRFELVQQENLVGMADLNRLLGLSARFKKGREQGL